MSPRFLATVATICLHAAPFLPAQEARKADGLPVPDGSTVVLLGDAFFERETNAGHVETLLTASLPGRSIRIRNLGWSGDTPRCESRSYFGPPAEGFERLTKQLAEIKPSAVVFCYGAVDSFRGEAGLPSFVDAYRRMLDMVEKTTGATMILLSPPPAQTLRPPMPDMSAQNRNRSAYRDAIRTLAAERKVAFGDLFAEMTAETIRAETVNGVNFTDEGYRQAAPAVLRALGIEPRTGLDDAALEPLRKAILAKNRLFFHRWRPQNEIYLFGARKHEQGNNAVEIPLFDPLIDKAEGEIATLAAALPASPDRQP